MNSLKDVKTLVVHGGVFHCDDVMVAVMVRSALRNAGLNADDLKIERVFTITDEMRNDPNTLIADVGRGKYDHHQDDAYIDESGFKYAACGLVFKDFEEEITGGRKVSNDFRRRLKGIQYDDNGVKNGETQEITDIVSAMNPEWNSPKDQTFDICFMNAVLFVESEYFNILLKKGYLTVEDQVYLNTVNNELQAKHFQASKEAEAIVKAADRLCDGKIVVLKQFVPWQITLCNENEPLFVVSPAVRGGYNLQCVPPVPNSFDQRMPLPRVDDWNPQGCIFKHVNRFLAAFDTEENAINAALYVINSAE